MNGQQRPGWHFANAQDDLNLRILRTWKAHFRFALFEGILLSTNRIIEYYRHIAHAQDDVNAYFAHVEDTFSLDAAHLFLVFWDQWSYFCLPESRSLLIPGLKDLCNVV